MLALPLRLPTASYGGHMGHFLLSVLTLTGSAPFSNTLKTFMRPTPTPQNHYRRATAVGGRRRT